MPLHLEKATIQNKMYRKVINTTPQIQLVLMSLLPGQEIGLEKHSSTTQFIKIESGSAIAIISGRRQKLETGDSIIIPPGKYHNIIADQISGTKLYTIYSPPEHPKKLVQRIKK